MTDFEPAAAAEDRSFAADTAWIKELAEEHGAPIADANGVLRFPVSEGEERHG